MGLSGALLEQVQYTIRKPGRTLTSTLADYLVATACEMPNFEIIPMHTPNRRTPAGIKGMAEGGVMGAIGAVDQCGQRRARAVQCLGRNVSR